MKSYLKRIVISLTCAVLFALFCFGFIFVYSSYASYQPVVATSNQDGSITYSEERYYPVEVDSSCVSIFATDKYLGQLNTNFSPSSIYSIKYVNNNNYLCVACWDGNSIYSKAKETLKKGGKITSLYLGHYGEYRITNEKDCQTLLSLKTMSGKPYTYKAESSGSFSIPIYGCYDNSVIATQSVGNIAYKDHKWIFVSPEQVSKSYDESRPSSEWTYTGIIISDTVTAHELDRILTGVDRLKG